MITILHRGGYAQMITILHGGGSLGTPKSDYVICAGPLILKKGICLVRLRAGESTPDHFQMHWTISPKREKSPTQETLSKENLRIKRENFPKTLGSLTQIHSHLQ